MSGRPRRVLVAWCPDWPVVSAAAEEGLSRRLPAAVFSDNHVVVCNLAARAEGVRRGMRRRDAQARCPDLVLFTHDPDRDARAFEPVLAAVEALRPGVTPLRPGLLAIRSPERYYGSAERAAAVLAETLVGEGVWDVRTGVADDLFTAEQAARQATAQGCVVVPEGGAPAFLGELPVTVLADGDRGNDLAGLLQRLGLRRLRDFAALPAPDVLTRFGEYGARMHRLARGGGSSSLAARTPPPELTGEIDFEPPLDSTEAVCFSVRRTVEEFVSRLAERDLVCTAVRIEAITDRGTVSARTWTHARWFGPADLVDRVHWQLQGAAGLDRLNRRGLDGPVAGVRFDPETVEPAGDHADTLWGTGTDQRVERGIAKVQAMLGYDAALRPVRQGGRSPADRQRLVPWGEHTDRYDDPRPVASPWPGSLPAPAPVRVFTDPCPSAVLGESGQPVRLDRHGAVSSPPARFRPATPRAQEGWQPVDAWAGPWPVDERWWEPVDPTNPAALRPHLVARFQVVGADGRAWLLRCDGTTWVTEAAYD